MINNRQQGRRRGRGGQRPQGNPGQPGGGNRIDNRARGNAQQLHEKYRNLAQESQRSGDRVTTEYYLQFADHYFRVLSESRARFEDQNQRRPQGENEDEYDGEGGDDEFAPRVQQQNQQPRYEERRERTPERAQADGERVERGEQDRDGEDGQRRQRRPRNRNRDESEPRAQANDPGETFEADRLPPSIAPVGSDTDEGGEAQPRRRGRRPRLESANDPVEVPPAA